MGIGKVQVMQSANPAVTVSQSTNMKFTMPSTVDYTYIVNC